MLAGGPGVGKSMTTIGLCAAAAARGSRVTPFKAVLVTDDPHASGMEGHLLAAGLSRDSRVGPVVVRRSAFDRGEAELLGHRLGTVRLHGSDSADLTSLPSVAYQHAHDAVLNALHALVATFEHVVIEGAGGIGDADPAADLPNVLAPRAVDATAYILARCPGHYPEERIGALESTWFAAAGTQVAGHVLTGCPGSCDAVEQAYGQPLLGHVPLLDRIVPGLPQWITVETAQSYLSACESAIRHHAPELLAAAVPVSDGRS
ncbi:hypothetical protein AB0918_27560 [Streptomyces sp. NPDC006864]|uniref:nucleotide-binding protein n=1 Tax=Streptomyces sp. NPDC006864 TaxID=3154780 RepID=UPI0034521911